MKPGSLFVRSWLPNESSNTNFSDGLTIYDAGNIQGFLITSSVGKTTWVVFQIESRMLQEDGTVLEFGSILPESLAPLHYFSITHYPLRQEQLERSQTLFSLPCSQILLTLSSAPQQLPLQPQSQKPSLPQPPRGAGPESRGSPKSGSSMPTGGQPSSRNKSRTLPKQTVLSSSSPSSRAQPLSRVPKTQEEHPLLSAPRHHTDHESSGSPPWTSLAQQSLYSRPPPELEGERVEPV